MDKAKKSVIIESLYKVRKYIYITVIQYIKIHILNNFYLKLKK